MAKIPSVDELAAKLNMTPSDVESFKQGNIVTDERDATNHKDLSLLVAVMLPSSLEKTWQFVIDNRVSECQDANLVNGEINLETFELEGFKFDHGTSDILSKFNLSKAEKSEFAKAKDKESAFLRNLSDRAKSFWENGLKGIVPYDGSNHDVADDLETANKAVLKIAEDPEIREEVAAIPAKSKNPEMHLMKWSIVQGKTSANIVLSHHILIKKAEHGFCTVTRKFYSGTDFDSSMIMVGVLPTSDKKSGVFYVNHTFTPAVAGFGGGAKRSIGRKLMKVRNIFFLNVVCSFIVTSIFPFFSDQFLWLKIVSACMFSGCSRWNDEEGSNSPGLT